MKIKIFTGWLVLTLLMGIPSRGYSQFFIAGQHHTGNYFVDLNPDKTLTGPNNHIFPFLPAASYQIDINGDGINDFSLYSIGSWVNGWGDSEISIRIHDTSTCQVAFGYMDTCHTPNSTYLLYKVAKSLKKNDTINNNLAWVNSTLYITYTSWAWLAYNCVHNGFVKDSLGNYLAVRMLQSNDTIYGWIQVTDISFLTFTVQEFACSKNCTSIDEHTDFARIYPIPTNSTVTIETQLSDFDLVVYNQYGKEITKKKQISGKTQIDLTGMANGVYVFKLFNDNSMMIRKIIKQD